MVVISQISRTRWDTVESVFVCEVLMTCMTFILTCMTLTILRPVLSGPGRRLCGVIFHCHLNVAVGKEGISYFSYSSISLIEKN